MNLSRLLKGSAFSALAAATVFTAIPAAAEAQDRHRNGRSEESSSSGENRPQVRQSRPVQREARSENPRSESPRSDNRGERHVEVAQARSGRDLSRSDNRGERRGDLAQMRSGREWSRSDSSGRQVAYRGEDNRNRSYSDQSRNRSYRSDDRDGRRYGQRDGSRDDRRDGRRDGYREYRGDDDSHASRYRSHNTRRDFYREGRDYQRWDRDDWRRSNRYNWYDYRRSNRHIYHLGSYYSPYRNHGYSRVSIGFYLDSLFFGSRYWINEPSYYRLPDVYGPYRWVRYYDDVLLVDIYSGEVVDEIQNFFW